MVVTFPDVRPAAVPVTLVPIIAGAPVMVMPANVGDPFITNFSPTGIVFTCGTGPPIVFTWGTGPPVVYSGFITLVRTPLIIENVIGPCALVKDAGGALTHWVPSAVRILPAVLGDALNLMLWLVMLIPTPAVYAALTSTYSFVVKCLGSVGAEPAAILTDCNPVILGLTANDILFVLEFLA